MQRASLQRRPSWIDCSCFWCTRPMCHSVAFVSQRAKSRAKVWKICNSGYGRLTTMEVTSTGMDGQQSGSRSWALCFHDTPELRPARRRGAGLAVLYPFWSRWKTPTPAKLPRARRWEAGGFGPSEDTDRLATSPISRISYNKKNHAPRPTSTDTPPTFHHFAETSSTLFEYPSPRYICRAD